jgi:hypothetical protein
MSIMDWWKSGKAQNVSTPQPYQGPPANQALSMAQPAAPTSTSGAWDNYSSQNLGQYLGRKWDLNGIFNLMKMGSLSDIDYSKVVQLNDPSGFGANSPNNVPAMLTNMDAWGEPNYLRKRDLGV